MIYAFDTETTGVDFWHGAKPYLVTFCNEQYENTWFEWDVDPLTRAVEPPREDLEQIIAMIEEADLLILQNSKFDVHALKTILPRKFMDAFPWKKVRDTLISAHLLASNHLKDLNSQAVEYLGVNITPYEKRMQKAVQYCRNLVRKVGSPIGDWRIAKEGLPEMPSAKDSSDKNTDPLWKFDAWLPMAVLKWAINNERLDIIPDLSQEDIENGVEHDWFNVTQEYANTDSTVTLSLDDVHQKLIDKRGLRPWYERRLKVLPVIYDMEERGVTGSESRLDSIHNQYIEESAKAGKVCTDIAKKFNYELTLPKSGNNKSLLSFAFDPDKLNLPVLERSEKTGAPALNKGVVESYLVTLDAGSDQLAFVENLSAKRKRDTALIFMRSYKKFWLPVDPKRVTDYYVVHPSLNPTAADTLRMSSSNPNEQNISKKEGFNLRCIFGPAPGREWWSLDAKNIELRIPAYESGEHELIDLFERPDDPPYYGSTHLLNFHTVYDDIWDRELEELTAEFGRQRVEDAYKLAWAKVGPHCKKKFAATWYQYCKNGGFAVQYGSVDLSDQGKMGTADKAFHKAGAHARLKARFSRLENLNQKYINDAERTGYVETMIDRSLGCDRGYPLLCTRSERGYILATVPLNYHVQSTAMWWMNQAMIRTDAQLSEWRREGFDAFITMQIHDELVFDFPRGRGLKPWRTNLPRIERLASIMAQGGDDIGVPTPVGIEYHSDNWAEGVTLR